MKKLSLYVFLVLMFCNVGLSDVKSEECLAIEDICVGDSALDYFTEKELKDTQHFYYKDKKFVTSIFNSHPTFKTYEGVEIDYEFSDKKYIIRYVVGYFNTNLDDCLNKKKEISDEVFNQFNKKGKSKNYKNTVDEKGESMVYEIKFNLDSDIVIIAECYDWSKRMEKQYFDNFSLVITTKKYDAYTQGNLQTY